MKAFHWLTFARAVQSFAHYLEEVWNENKRQ